MSITVNVVGQTNIVTSITNSDTVDVGIGTFVAQAVTGLLVVGGNNVTVSTTSGVFTIIGRDPPVLSVNGKTGVVSLVASDVLAAPQSHTHVVANINDFPAGVKASQSVSSVAGRTGTITLTTADITDFNASDYGKVFSVNGRTGTVTLVASDVSAASAIHTHVVANITDFATEAAKHGPVSSVNGRTGTITLVATDVSAASATHAHSYVQVLNGQTGTVTIAAGANVTVTTSAGVITIAAASGSTATGGGQVSSVNGQTGTVTLVSTDVSAASAVHTHVAANITDLTNVANVVSVNGLTGSVTVTAAPATVVSVGTKSLVGSVDNYDAGTTDIVRVSATVASDITGISGGGEGILKLVTNVGTNPLTIVQEGTSSDATNRFLVVRGSRRIEEGDSVSTFYDATSQRWRLITDPPAMPAFQWTAVSTTAIHNYSGTHTVLRINAGSTALVTGVANGYEGRAIRFINVATSTVTIVHQSTASDSTNRFITADGLDRQLDQNDQAEALYDPYSSRWRVTPCCGGGY